MWTDPFFCVGLFFDDVVRDSSQFGGGDVLDKTCSLEVSMTSAAPSHRSALQAFAIFLCVLRALLERVMYPSGSRMRNRKS